MECYSPSEAAHGLAGLPPQRRLNAAVCDEQLGVWHTPRFMLLGFPKCGTSEFWELLHLFHPQVRRRDAFHKEIHLFDRLPLLHAVGAPSHDPIWRTEDFNAHPTQLFRQRLPTNLSADEVCGDGTPWYACHLDSLRIVARVQRWAPSASFIVLLRSPVRATWSIQCMFQHNVIRKGQRACGNASGPFDVSNAGDAFDMVALGFLRMFPPSAATTSECLAARAAREGRTWANWDGRAMPHELLWAYAERLRVWRAGFARSRFLLLGQEDLSDARGLLRAFDFLGLRPLGPLRRSRVHRFFSKDSNRTRRNVASGGNTKSSLTCACGRDSGPQSSPDAPAGGAARLATTPATTPSAEALSIFLLIYLGPDFIERKEPGMPTRNPFPEAQVDTLVTQGWVEPSFIEPWLADARLLGSRASLGALRRLCPHGEPSTS